MSRLHYDKFTAFVGQHVGELGIGKLCVCVCVCREGERERGRESKKVHYLLQFSSDPCNENGWYYCQNCIVEH